MLYKKYNGRILQIVFQQACRKGYSKVVELLLNLRGKRYINRQTEDAFEWACNNGHTEIVKLLLNLKGDRKITRPNNISHYSTEVQNLILRHMNKSG